MNLIELFKIVPQNTKLYSPLYGDITFDQIRNMNFEDKNSPLILYFKTMANNTILFTHEGKPMIYHPSGEMIFETTFGECMIFPSKDERDWNTFVEHIIKNM